MLYAVLCFIVEKSSTNEWPSYCNRILTSRSVNIATRVSDLQCATLWSRKCIFVRQINNLYLTYNFKFNLKQMSSCDEYLNYSN